MLILSDFEISMTFFLPGHLKSANSAVMTLSKNDRSTAKSYRSIWKTIQFIKFSEI
jgi:hypothetical protein